jgi:hypothetical protein
LIPATAYDFFKREYEDAFRVFSQEGIIEMESNEDGNYQITVGRKMEKVMHLGDHRGFWLAFFSNDEMYASFWVYEGHRHPEDRLLPRYNINDGDLEGGSAGAGSIAEIRKYMDIFMSFLHDCLQELLKIEGRL